MSDQFNEQTPQGQPSGDQPATGPVAAAEGQPAAQTAPADVPSETTATFPLSFAKRETGRTHTVTGQGVQPILDADGNVETEYVLSATIDGQEVVLQRFGGGIIDSAVDAARRRSEQASGQ